MGKLIKRPRASIEKYLKAQPQSGLTVEQYCKKHHIAVSTFWNWRKKFREISDRQTSAQFVKLLPVQLATTPAIELRTSTFTISIPFGSDESSLRSILTIVMDICSKRVEHAA
jgi:hypothetical protein